MANEHSGRVESIEDFCQIPLLTWYHMNCTVIGHDYSILPAISRFKRHLIGQLALDNPFVPWLDFGSCLSTSEPIDRMQQSMLDTDAVHTTLHRNAQYGYMQRSIIFWKWLQQEMLGRGLRLEHAFPKVTFGINGRILHGFNDTKPCFPPFFALHMIWRHANTTNRAVADPRWQSW